MNVVTSLKDALHFLNIVRVINQYKKSRKLDCLTACKGVAISALGHPRVKFELLFQVVSSFLQLTFLGQD